MGKIFYPAIFSEAEEGGFYITFPDFDYIFTQGEDLNEAYEMAIDALGLEIAELDKQKKEIPQPSNPSAIQTKETEKIVIIEFDLEQYRRKMNSSAVKKTLSIPSWLNEEALAHGINFSAVLQQALKAELGIN